MQNDWWAIAFSGFGVAVVSGVLTLIHRHFKEEKDNVPPQNSTTQNIVGSTVTGAVAGRDLHIGQLHLTTTSLEADECHEKPTPEEMKAEIDKVSIYAQSSVADTFAGLKVRWRGVLKNISLVRNRTDVVIDVGGGAVVGGVSIDDYPFLKTVRSGEPVTVEGTIDRVQTNGLVILKVSKLVRRSEQSSPRPSDGGSGTIQTRILDQIDNRSAEWDALSNKFGTLTNRPIPIYADWIYTKETDHYDWWVRHSSDTDTALCIEYCKEGGQMLMMEPTFQQKFPDVAAITDEGDRWLLAIYKIAKLRKIYATLSGITKGVETTGEGGKINDLPGASKVLCQMARNRF
jgi:hypothetical protein